MLRLWPANDSNKDFESFLSDDSATLSDSSSSSESSNDENCVPSVKGRGHSAVSSVEKGKRPMKRKSATRSCTQPVVADQGDNAESENQDVDLDMEVESDSEKTWTQIRNGETENEFRFVRSAMHVPNLNDIRLHAGFTFR